VLLEGKDWGQKERFLFDGQTGELLAENGVDTTPHHEPYGQIWGASWREFAAGLLGTASTPIPPKSQFDVEFVSRVIDAAMADDRKQ
jgi:hypothetical protein